MIRGLTLAALLLLGFALAPLGPSSGPLASGPFAPSSAVPSAQAEQSAPTVFPLRVEVAQVDGEAVMTRAWLDARVVELNRIYAPAAVAFEVASFEPSDHNPDLVTRVDRHRLGPLVDTESGQIHVFLVRSMQDVDVANHALQGVHWRSRRGGGYRHFVIATAIGSVPILAHELGHFFGNPHSDTPGNIMSYTRGDGPPFLDDGQIARIRRLSREFIESGELVPVGSR